MLYYFSDFFDNFYKQNSNLELIWKCILTGGLHKHAILITVTVVVIYWKQPRKNTECIYKRFMHKGVFFLATTTCFEYFMCAKILFSSRSRIYNNIYSYM